MDSLLSYINLLLILFCVYELASLAGLFSERSGIANIAIEGSMIIGAVVFGICYENFFEITGSNTSATIAISLIITVPSSALFSMLLAILANRYKADQIIAGTGMNLLAPVLGFLLYNIFTVQGHDLQQTSILITINDWQIPIDTGSAVPNRDLNWFVIMFIGFTIIAMAVTAYILNKSTFGLRLKSSGENPYALETSGVSVNKMRYIAIYISGCLSSMAGIIFIVKGNFFFTVNGSGFLALGVLILGQYKVIGTMIGSIVLAAFISFFNTLPGVLGYGGAVDSLSNIMYTIPFIIPIIGLIIFRKNSFAPKAVGTNFKKDQR